MLHISTRLIIGGSQENTVLSCEGHVRHGHECHLAFGPIYGPEGSMLSRVETFRHHEGGAARVIHTHEVPDLVRELAPSRDRRCMEQLRRLILDVAPDIVHTHSSKAGVLGRLAAWGLLKRKRWTGAIIHTVHGPPFHRYEKRWRNALYIAAERIAAKRCHAIVCVASAMREQFLRQRIGAAKQYRVIRSGMETRPYLAPLSASARHAARAGLGLNDSDIVIGTVARLSDLKGHDDLIDALTPIMRDDERIKLLWVGDGWLRERLEGRLRERNMRERVVITGVVRPEKVPGLVKLMDLLVHPSHREGLPRTVVQALLAGVPVVASAVDGTPEVIDDGATGRLFPPKRVEAIGETVRWMLSDPERAAATAASGRDACAEAFDAERMIDQLEALYEEVLGRVR